MWWMTAALAAKTILGQNAQNEVSKAQNKLAMQNTAKQLNDIAIQRAQSRDRTEVAIFNSRQQRLQEESQVGLQASASGTMGASVRDAVATVQLSSSRREAGIADIQATQEEGFRLMSDKAIDDGLSSMDLDDPYDRFFQSALGAGASMLGKYVGDAVSSGGGSEKSTAGAEQSALQGSAYNNYDLWGNKGSGQVHTW